MRWPTGRCAAWPGRPMALKRFVEGAAGDFFFQKRAPKSKPDWIETVELSFPSGRTADEVVLRDAGPAGLGDQPRLHRPEPPPDPGRGPRPPRRAAGRPRSRAGRALVADPRRGHGDPGGPGRRRPGRLAEDLRLARHPHQRPDRAAVDVSRSPAGRAGPGPGRRAARARHRHLEVVEGGAPRRVPRLQPEREGPDRGLGLLGPAHTRRPRVDAPALGGRPRRGGRGLHAGHRAGALRRARRPGRRDRRGSGLARGPARPVGPPRGRGTRRRPLAAPLPEAGGRAAAGHALPPPDDGPGDRDRQGREEGRRAGRAGAVEGAAPGGRGPPRAGRRPGGRDAGTVHHLDPDPGEPRPRPRGPAPRPGGPRPRLRPDGPVGGRRGGLAPGPGRLPADP